MLRHPNLPDNTATEKNQFKNSLFDQSNINVPNLVGTEN
jgi:hypothetical protein